MANFLEMITNFFRGDKEKEKLPVIIQIQKKPTVAKEEKKEKEDRAQEIIQELKRVTPSHPAYEILGNVTALNPKTIADHKELGNLLLDIIHTVNKDPAKYHDPKWLQDKMRRLTIFYQSLGSSPEAQKILDIENNIEKLYKRSQKDRPESNVKDEIDKIQAGEWKPEDTDPDMGSKSIYNPPEGTWETILSGAEYTDLKQKLTEASKKADGGRAYAETFVAASREASKKIKPGETAAMNNYLTIQKAFEAAGSAYLKENPREGGRFMSEMREYGREFVEKRIQTDADYRDYWFYRILENVLYNHKIDSHRELYQLYESGEMHDFLEIVRRIKTEDGRRTGLNLAQRYDILKNTIFQSHDMDYYCAHPQQDMKEFIGSTSLFLNEYIDAATQDPMVALAKRMYEAALLHMRDSHGGYLPREWLAWQEGKTRASKLDDMVEGYLKQAIASGQLHDVKIDKITGLPSPSMWNRKQVSDKPYTLSDLYGGESEHSEGWKRQLGELKIAAALKQAKGLALVDQTLLAIISKSKGTGTKYVLNNNEWKVTGFNSVPYEGIVRYLDPVIHYYGRFSVGMDISNAFFNMIVSDRPNWNWDPNHMKVLIPMYHDGKFKEAQEYCDKHGLGDIQTRLNAQDNPFGYSSMWGTMTKWRVGDSTAGFDDWEKDQGLAGAVKLTNIGDTFSAPERDSSFQKWGSTWAFQKAKQYFSEVNNPDYKICRNEFRKYLLDSNEIRYTEMAQKDLDTGYDEGFESEWRTVGIRRYRKRLDAVLEKAGFDKHEHAVKGSELDLLTKRLERAYKARVWVQTTMKAPLIVARQLDVEVSKFGEDKKGPLRKKIIWEILGIDLDALELRGGQDNLTPTAIQEAAFDRISDVEGALASLQQTAIRENRDLIEDDFQKAIDVVADSKTGDPKQKQNFENAREYWRKVKKAMFGDKTASDYYDALGIKDAPNGNTSRGLRFHQIDWAKIKNINIDEKSRHKSGQFIVSGLGTELLNNELIDRNWRHLFSTEDMGWEFLNTNALGPRNPVRRAGDLGSHVAFGQLFEKYMIDHVQRPKPNIEKMVEAQHEMWVAMSGDFQDVASEAMGRIAYSSGMIFKKADWAWKLPFGSGPLLTLVKDSSIAQMIHGRDRGDTWGPNEMLQYVQAVGSHILPRERYSRLSGEETMPNSEWSRTLLGKRLGGTKPNAIYEILNMTVFIATILMIYQAFTKKSEEEEEKN